MIRNYNLCGRRFPLQLGVALVCIYVYVPKFLCVYAYVSKSWKVDPYVRLYHWCTLYIVHAYSIFMCVYVCIHSYLFHTALRVGTFDIHGPSGEPHSFVCVECTSLPLFLHLVVFCRKQNKLCFRIAVCTYNIVRSIISISNKMAKINTYEKETSNFFR